MNATTATNSEKFAALVLGYVPCSDDNPDNLTWYAQYFAIKAILLENGALWEDVEMLTHNSAPHDPADWEGVMRGILFHCPNPPEKPKSYGGMCYGDFEPDDNSESRAREIFKGQYKTAFPGKRINSKHAKEQWEKVKGKALEMAKGEFAVKKMEWNMRNEKRLEAVAAVDAKHQEKVDRYLRIKAVVSLLESE